MPLLTRQSGPAAFVPKDSRHRAKGRISGGDRLERFLGRKGRVVGEAALALADTDRAPLGTGHLQQNAGPANGRCVEW